MQTPANSHPPPLNELLPCLKQELPGILADEPVMVVYLYGSMAEGYPLPSSDVDIALVLSPDCELSRPKQMQLEFEIAAKIEKGCGVREADVRIIDNAPLTFQGDVLTNGILLYSKDEDFRVDFEVSTRKRYFDFLPVIEMMQEAFFESLREEGLVRG